jgi:hypothetical protein
MSLAFTEGTRPNGEKFRKLKDGSPQWMVGVACEAHRVQGTDFMLPDDHRYEMIERAVNVMAECKDLEEYDDRTIDEGAPVYTDELLAWVYSHIERVHYCDEAIENGLAAENMASILAGGWITEFQEVAHLVRQAIIAMVESEEEEPETDGS